MVEGNLNCESDTRPEEYIIENILDGKCDIILNENIEEHTRETESGETKTYFTYDMYRIVKNNYRDTLEDDLKDNAKFNIWLDFAKEQYENQAENVPLEERLSTAEAVIAEILGGEVQSMSAIVKFYVLQIKMKKMTLDDVPAKWRKQVEEELEKESE